MTSNRNESKPTTPFKAMTQRGPSLTLCVPNHLCAPTRHEPTQWSPPPLQNKRSEPPSAEKTAVGIILAITGYPCPGPVTTAVDAATSTRIGVGSRHNRKRGLERDSDSQAQMAVPPNTPRLESIRSEARIGQTKDHEELRWVRKVMAEKRR